MMHQQRLHNNLREDASERVLVPEDIRTMVFTCDRSLRTGLQGLEQVARGVNYVYPMMASYWMSGPLAHRIAGFDLMVDSQDVDYLWNFFKHTEKVSIHPVEDGMLDNLPTTGDEMGCMRLPHRRLTRNYMRTIRYALTTPEKGFLICEDDVVFRDNFWDYALDSINEMRCTKLPKDGNTLVFYHRPQYIGKNSYYRGRYFCSAGGGFEGLCGVYYDRECLESLLEYLVNNEHRLPADLLYAEWSAIEWTRYAPPAGIIQHVGGVSAGTSKGSYWTAPNFEKPIHCWDPGWKEVPYERFHMRKD